jgi:hypothetical protein
VVDKDEDPRCRVTTCLQVHAQLGSPLTGSAAGLVPEARLTQLERPTLNHLTWLPVPVLPSLGRSGDGLHYKGGLLDIFS